MKDFFMPEVKFRDISLRPRDFYLAFLLTLLASYIHSNHPQSTPFLAFLPTPLDGHNVQPQLQRFTGLECCAMAFTALIVRLRMKNSWTSPKGWFSKFTNGLLGATMGLAGGILASGAWIAVGQWQAHGNALLLVAFVSVLTIPTLAPAFAMTQLLSMAQKAFIDAWPQCQPKRFAFAKHTCSVAVCVYFTLCGFFFTNTTIPFLH